MSSPVPPEPLPVDERHRLLLADALELPQAWSWKLLLDAVRNRVVAFQELVTERNAALAEVARIRAEMAAVLNQRTVVEPMAQFRLMEQSRNLSEQIDYYRAELSELRKQKAAMVPEFVRRLSAALLEKRDTLLVSHPSGGARGGDLEEAARIARRMAESWPWSTVDLEASTSETAAVPTNGPREMVDAYASEVGGVTSDDLHDLLREQAAPKAFTALRDVLEAATFAEEIQPQDDAIPVLPTTVLRKVITKALDESLARDEEKRKPRATTRSGC